MCFSFPIPRGDSLWLYSLSRGHTGKTRLKSPLTVGPIQPVQREKGKERGKKVRADCIFKMP